MGQKMEPTDLVLVGQVMDGDIAAFNQLISRWERAVYNFVYRVVGHEEDAKDLVQETVIRVYHGLGRLKDPNKFPSWLFRIAHNVCLDRLRSGKHRPMVSTDALPEGGVERLIDDRIDFLRGRTDPEDAVYRKELSSILGRALQGLSEEQRTAVVMREYNGYSSKEIAEILGVPVGTVRSRVFHGLRNLGRVLKRLRAEEGR
ncbi:MAG: sigma-70 family RNA polymerase sigma factor [Candidatus Eisenbacteria bacterium]